MGVRQRPLAPSTRIVCIRTSMRQALTRHETNSVAARDRVEAQLNGNLFWTLDEPNSMGSVATQPKRADQAIQGSRSVAGPFHLDPEYSLLRWASVGCPSVGALLQLAP